ncbi:MAG: M56 family metallopeptidase [Lachnospiraceae bacterium]|nr:M56 family metallopeptidase [uncultured Acetatifactor sp.]MCI9218503.1 M56 family metallopeptidase [Lachnospiraceae bacterium]
MGLIQRSFCGGVLILVIIAVRILWLDKLPKRTFPVLWSLALIRLLLPFSFSSVFSLYTFLQMAGNRAMPAGYSGGMWEGVTFTGNPPAWTVVQDLALGQSAAKAEQGSSIQMLPAIWCAGAVSLALFFLISYAFSLRKFRKAIPVKDGRILQWLEECSKGRRRQAGRISVRQSGAVLAPLTYGCLRPVILLPAGALESGGHELRYILLHESVHIRHHDAALKLAMVAALCLHWFNPLVWLMCGLMNRDIELACDEGVLRHFGQEARAGYAMTLIGMEEKKRVLLPLYNGFSKNAIEERVSLIMKYRKMKKTAMMASLLLVAGMALVFTTSARTVEATGSPAQNWKSGAEAGKDGADSGSRDTLPLDPPPNGIGSSVDAKGEDVHIVDSDVYASGENTETATAQNESATGDPGTAWESQERIRQGQEYVLCYMQEGMPQEEPANLYIGQGYGLLIPVEGWKAGGSNEWVYEFNDQVRFWVADYRGKTLEQAWGLLEEDGYLGTEQGILRKEDGSNIFYAWLTESGDRTMGIHYVYPAAPEYEEGFGTALAAIAASFGVLQEDRSQLEEVGRLERLVLAFWEAYLTGEAAGLRPYLAADYEGDVETFPDGQDGHVAAQAQLLVIKGLDIAEAAVGEKVEIWVEFRPSSEADYLEYLTISAVKEQDGWKVSSYGLEM